LIRSFFQRITVSIVLGFIFIIIISKFVNLANNVWTALAAGTGCALVYVLSGYFSYYFAFNKNQRLFIRVFIFSLAARFVILLSLIVVVLKFTNVQKEYFLISLFIWYFIFQIWEVISLNNLSRKKV